jgi:thiol-disulfide isomerase/thioredoxin
MRKLSIIFLTVILSAVFILPASRLGGPNFVSAQEAAPVYLTLFYGDGCPHCAKEEAFLNQLEKEFPNLKIRRLEVWYNQDNVKLMKEVAQKLNITVTGVPLTVIGEETISGYLNDQTTGQRIRNIVQQHSAVGCFDTVGDVIGENGGEGEVVCEDDKLPEAITLPFFGEIETKAWSLPFLTIVIAAIDGFNPCAMWVLLFLISLLLGMKDKKKMWTLGSAFIVASAVVYFFFLAAWLNLFLFLGFIAAIRIIVGLVAIGSGSWHLKEWWSNRNATCRAVNEEKREKIMDKLRRVTEQRVFWLALVGIIGVAVAVNLVELVCSAGLPAIYTQILSLSNLSTPVYYLYLLLYILIFMLDDLLIFVIAMTTLQATGISKKYTHWANLFGGIIILILGLLLIFKPGWIMFG